LVAYACLAILRIAIGVVRVAIGVYDVVGWYLDWQLASVVKVLYLAAWPLD
jgi:hypothetical protein